MSTQPFPNLVPGYTRTLYTATLAAANTEYSTATTAIWSPNTPVLTKAKAIRFGLRGSGTAQMRWSLTAGRVAGATEPHALRPAGYYEALNDGVAGATVYFAANAASQVLELEVLSDAT